MLSHDPYRPDESYYECLDCQHRTTSAGHVGSCSECGGTVCNLAVARE